MSISIGGVISWLIVGVMAGSVTGSLVKWKKEGFGYLTNLGVGLVGATLGVLFSLVVEIDKLKAIAIDLQDILAALVGSLIFVGVVWAVRRRRAKPTVAGGV